MRDLISKIMPMNEACRRIGIKDSTMRGHIMKGKFKKGKDCIKLGGSWMFSKEALKREYPYIELGLLRGEYNKVNYPDLIEPEDIGENSCLVGYIPGDINMLICPRLIINKYLVLGYFRGYYFKNMEHDVAHPKSEATLSALSFNKDNISTTKLFESNRLTLDCLDRFKDVEDFLTTILTFYGYDDIYFTESELRIAELWLKDTINMYASSLGYGEDLYRSFVFKLLEK